MLEIQMRLPVRLVMCAGINCGGIWFILCGRVCICIPKYLWLWVCVFVCVCVCGDETVSEYFISHCYECTCIWIFVLTGQNGQRNNVISVDYFRHHVTGAYRVHFSWQSTFQSSFNDTSASLQFQFRKYMFLMCWNQRETGHPWRMM